MELPSNSDGSFGFRALGLGLGEQLERREGDTKVRSPIPTALALAPAVQAYPTLAKWRAHSVTYESSSHIICP